MNKVQILMSTYNGEEFIEELCQSLFNQSYPHISLFVRDDGSNDGTVRKIKKLSKANLNKIRYIEGDNIGVIQSFFNLLQCSDDNAAFYCFCDQDDVWMSDKVDRAVQQLEKCENAAMFFSSTLLVDKDLNELRVWPESPQRQPSFYNALVQNIAVGATIMINKAARDMLLTRSVNVENLLMHDWWVYTCVSAFGEVIYDPKPTIYYRQHGNNVVGGNVSIVHKWCKKWGSFRKNFGKKLLKRQAVEFYRIYGELLDKEKLEQLKLFIQPRTTLRLRMDFLRKTKVYRQSWIENQLFKFLIIIGYI
ncbi:glycosyltransferase family 2 protein [Paenibacillus sp. NAIST15-1]|uniref:glycosyltransferase family 2 protein n=1 Tax=Paenibacillus sp. NAIST15-1 TaxID=1605994 RepID=UPI00086C02C7|nr:glycosyltransferase family 2 protein [Paenibacillus sp. NAIST15-1]GAV12369.1 spore coat polysaccharide biosynthesis protein spsA [Paenibacillus sp. NAIST15-1]